LIPKQLIPTDNLSAVKIYFRITPGLRGGEAAEKRIEREPDAHNRPGRLSMGACESGPARADAVGWWRRRGQRGCAVGGSDGGVGQGRGASRWRRGIGGAGAVRGWTAAARDRAPQKDITIITKRERQVRKGLSSSPSLAFSTLAFCIPGAPPLQEYAPALTARTGLTYSGQCAATWSRRSALGLLMGPSRPLVIIDMRKYGLTA
jgi:hypothetical protein